MHKHPLSPRRLLPLLVLCVALPASAGMFDGDALEALTKLRTEQNDRLDKLESASHNQLEVANQLQQLKDEVAKLRGQVELLTFEQDQAAKRQKDFYVDLDTRLRKMETASADASQQPAPKADPAAETQDFGAGLTLFKNGKFKDAAESFRNFIRTYPSSSFTTGAYYWGGNAHFQLREWAKAAELYAGLPAKWPDDPKAPDALLKLADAQQEMGDAKSARKTLESLPVQYPGTPAATQARQRLAKKK